MKLNKLLLKFVLLSQKGIQENSRKGNAKFNFLRDKLGEQEVLEGALFRFLKSLKSQIFTTIVPPPGGVYWVYYKPRVSSYSEVGT